MSMNNTTYEYPFVECSHHEGRQRCYIACSHVVEGQAKPRHILLATDEDAGELICAQCVESVDPENKEAVLKSFAPICEGCAIDRNLLLIH